MTMTTKPIPPAECMLAGMLASIEHRRDIANDIRACELVYNRMHPATKSLIDAIVAHRRGDIITSFSAFGLRVKGSETIGSSVLSTIIDESKAKHVQTALNEFSLAIKAGVPLDEGKRRFERQTSFDDVTTLDRYLDPHSPMVPNAKTRQEEPTKSG